MFKMKVTINTDVGTIQIHGSFTYGDYKEFMDTIPESWRQFKFEQPEVVRDNFYPSSPFPSYPANPPIGDFPPYKSPFYYTNGNN